MKSCSTRRPGSRDSGVASSRGSSGVRLPEHSVGQYDFESASSDHIPGEWDKLASKLYKKASESSAEGCEIGHKNGHQEEVEASHQVRDIITGSRLNPPNQVQTPQKWFSDGADGARSVRSSPFVSSLCPSPHSSMARLPNQISAKLQSIIAPPPALFLTASIVTCLLVMVCVMSWGSLVVFSVVGGLGAGLSGKWFNVMASIKAEIQEEEKEEEEWRGRSGRPTLPVFVSENSERFPGAFPE